MYKIFVIGISSSQLSPEQLTMLNSCSLLVATGRLADLAADFQGSIHPVTPIDKAISAIRHFSGHDNVAVFASGDPLFYGIGRKLLTEFPPEQLEFHPGLSAIQRGCALLKTPWDDAAIVSLHGRQHHHIPGLLLKRYKSIIFTDNNNSPQLITDKILSYLHSIDHTALIEGITLSVAEDIGLKTENIFRGSLKETTNRNFSPLNILCLQRPQLQSRNQSISGFGLSEDDICHSRGLITKNEVRAVTLHRLQLPATGVFWDVGGGSGSVSIEAARLNPDLIIYTIEHKGEELDNIKRNIRSFGCFNIIPVSGKAPEALAGLPSPDRVFIGGSGGALAEIVALLGDRLAVNGRLVINGVIEKTIRSAPQYMKENGFSVATSVINITRESRSGETTVFNPITILTGTR
ncbi:MAG: precorrin-6y C5,15-methyltransferase (decarboxylating) subunit CbiE [Deltaproteobacteria bacterium]|nr:precorrin-6y C5,15-methyltransferase (decarboxylating) subunit CbiE [Deltaproteobacteria bacterium]